MDLNVALCRQQKQRHSLGGVQDPVSTLHGEGRWQFAEGKRLDILGSVSLSIRTKKAAASYHKSSP